MIYLILLVGTNMRSEETMQILQISDIISILSVFVTIIGFVITYKCIKREYNLAILKEKNLYATKEMKDALDLSYDLFWAYADYVYFLESNSDKDKIEEKEKKVEKFQNIRNSLRQLIIKYGSIQSIKLWSYFEHNMKYMSTDKYYVQWGTSILILIISQIKYDIYGIKMSPIYIYLSIFPKQFKNDSYDLFLQKSKEYNNNLVNILELDDFLMIRNESIN